MRKFLLALILLSVLSARTSFAQSNFFTSWENRVRATSAKQPSWAVPVFMPTSGLVQLVRADIIRQYTSTHTTTWNYGGSKGFNLIPWYKTEVDLNLPAYIQHNSPALLDGAGDLSMLFKYRVFAANEQHGSYSISAGITATAPTGSYKNGAPDGTISPTIYLGKGFEARVTQHFLFDRFGARDANLGAADLGPNGPWGRYDAIGVRKYFGSRRW